MRREALRLFHEAFGAAADAAASAPGRVNLIGEHTDYNGGPVLPVAIAARTSVAVGRGESGMLDIVSAQVSLGRRPQRVAWKQPLPRDWGAYVGGVMRELWAAEVAPAAGGARVAVASDVPIDAGLASSAALTVAATRALTQLAGVTLSPRQVAGVAFRAEHDHVGVRCGVMDPMIAALARPGQALLLECASLAARHVPFRTRVLLVDTGVRRRLAVSEYNRRRAECEAAVGRLKVELPEMIWLASWPVEWLARLKKALPEPLRSRAVHVVSETARARYAAELLRRGRVAQAGRLLFESHDSLRRYFECSAPELDFVVAAARRAGALGAKLTGAGWGGSVVVLPGQAGATVEAGIRGGFGRKYGREPVITAVEASGGVRVERM
jgi:galactokinase